MRCLRIVFDKHPESRAVFGLRNASMAVMMNDERVRRQAAIIQDTIRVFSNSYQVLKRTNTTEMVINDLAADSGRLRWPLVTLGEQHSRMAHTRDFKREFLVTFGVALMSMIDELPLSALNRWKRWKTVRLWRRFVHFLMTCLITGFQLGLADRPQVICFVLFPLQTKRFSVAIEERCQWTMFCTTNGRAACE